MSSSHGPHDGASTMEQLLTAEAAGERLKFLPFWGTPARRTGASARTCSASGSHRVLVEASPVDRIWGIGLAHDDPAVEHPSRWRGHNLLGFALMQARAVLATSHAQPGKV